MKRHVDHRALNDLSAFSCCAATGMVTVCVGMDSRHRVAAPPCSETETHPVVLSDTRRIPAVQSSETDQRPRLFGNSTQLLYAIPLPAFLLSDLTECSYRPWVHTVRTRVLTWASSSGKKTRSGALTQGPPRYSCASTCDESGLKASHPPGHSSLWLATSA